MTRLPRHLAVLAMTMVMLMEPLPRAWTSACRNSKPKTRKNQPNKCEVCDLHHLESRLPCAKL